MITVLGILPSLHYVCRSRIAVQCVLTRQHIKYYIDIAPGEGGRERKWNYGIMGHEMVQRTC